MASSSVAGRARAARRAISAAGTWSSTTNARSIVDAGKRDTGRAAALERVPAASTTSRSSSATTTGAGRSSAATTAAGDLADRPDDRVADHDVGGPTRMQPVDDRGSRRTSATRSSPIERVEHRGGVVDVDGAVGLVRARRTHVRGSGEGEMPALGGQCRRRRAGAANTVPVSNRATAGVPCAALNATARKTPGSSAGRRIDSSAPQRVLDLDHWRRSAGPPARGRPERAAATCRSRRSPAPTSTSVIVRRSRCAGLSPPTLSALDGTRAHDADRGRRGARPPRRCRSRVRGRGGTSARSRSRRSS